MPFIDNEEFCKKNPKKLQPTNQKKKPTKKPSKTKQTHHQSEIKEVTKTQSIQKTAEEKTELMKIWREFPLALSISYTHLGQETTRPSTVCQQVLQEKKDGHAVPGHGKESCWPPFCPSPCLCPSIVQDRFQYLSLFLQQPSMRKSYQGCLHKLETSEIPYWLKVEKKLHKIHLKFQLHVFS